MDIDMTTTNLIEQLRAHAVEGTQTGTARFVQQRAADLLEAQAKQIAETALKNVSLFGELQNALDRIEALQSQLDDYTLMMTSKVEALQADAERYRAIRDGCGADLYSVLVELDGANLDAAIDAAKGNV